MSEMELDKLKSRIAELGAELAQTEAYIAGVDCTNKKLRSEYIRLVDKLNTACAQRDRLERELAIFRDYLKRNEVAENLQCEYCHDTGFYGDHEAGIHGNNEWHRCDQCVAEKCRCGSHVAVNLSGIWFCEKCQREVDMMVCRLHNIAAHNLQPEKSDD